MAVIIPCAGQSSRYPGTRPKYLLTVSNGECLFERAANLYVDCTDVHFVILREHAEKYDAEIAINKVYGHRDNVHIHVLDQPTSGPAETSYHVAMKLSDTPIFIQDCDSFFTSSLSEENYVCTVNLKDNLDVINVAAKSFTVTNEQGLLTNIVEKSVVSNHICVGGYGFKSADTFCRSFERLSEIHDGEIFVSHIIKELLQTNVFVAKDVQDYVDLGTYKEFVEYNKQRQTIFSISMGQSSTINPSSLATITRILLGRFQVLLSIFCKSKKKELQSYSRPHAQASLKTQRRRA